MSYLQKQIFYIKWNLTLFYNSLSQIPEESCLQPPDILHCLVKAIPLKSEGKRKWAVGPTTHLKFPLVTFFHFFFMRSLTSSSSYKIFISWNTSCQAKLNAIFSSLPPHSHPPPFFFFFPFYFFFYDRCTAWLERFMTYFSHTVYRALYTFWYSVGSSLRDSLC